MLTTAMNYLLFSCALLFVNHLHASQMSSLDDAMFAQTDVLIDRDLVYRYSEHFPECIEVEAEGLECSYKDLSSRPSTYYRFEGDGSTRTHAVSAHLWKSETVEWPRALNDFEKKGIIKQIEVLHKNALFQHQSFERKQLLYVARCLLNKEKSCRGGHQGDRLRAMRLAGSDGRGNVQFTGYFTPRIEAKKHRTDEFRYPIYKRPKEWRNDNGPHPTREDIDKNGILAGRGLEIAWTKRPLAIFLMQVQGSGIAHFEDGSEKLLSYDGKNGQAYVSIGRLLVEDGHVSSKSISLDAIEKFFENNPDKVEKYLYQNPSYVFFKSKGHAPTGSSGVSLIAGYSIAVDPKIIPYGSILIGRVPILDPSNRVVKKEWRLLFAQDTGGAIIGPGHVDLFTGIGDEAKNIASRMHHYGELWLLLPK